MNKLALFLVLLLRNGAPLPVPQEDRLTGVWDIRLTLPTQQTGSPAGQFDARGVIALVPDSARQFLWMGLQDATHFGVYLIDFTPAGLDLHSGTPVPIAAAKAENDSTVQVVINAAQDHEALRLRGVFRGDSLSGDWHETGYSQGAAGTFVMRRRK